MILGVMIANFELGPPAQGLPVTYLDEIERNELADTGDVEDPERHLEEIQDAEYYQSVPNSEDEEGLVQQVEDRKWYV